MTKQSMTGFGKVEIAGENYTLSVEVKSVNHRFKDIRFKMPSMFNSKEMELKKILEKNFIRGSFEIYVSYKKAQGKIDVVDIDTKKVETYLAKMQEVGENLDLEINFSPTDFIRQDFLKENTDKEEELIELLIPAFNEVVAKLRQSRNDEGDKLIEKLVEHKHHYFQHFEKVIALKESYQEALKEKLISRFEKYSQDLKIDEPRFMQELVYYLEKFDIDEEINRIKIHLKKLTKLLDDGGEVGRQIEFLLQELNRETNTIGSKSNNENISENIVQMKVQLEKIREQALNLQ